MVIILGMTTHSGDLLSFDLGQNSTLAMEGRSLKPARWEWTTKDSHHPEAALYFDGPAPAGGIKLTISNLRGANLEFSW